MGCRIVCTTRQLRENGVVEMMERMEGHGFSAAFQGWIYLKDERILALLYAEVEDIRQRCLDHDIPLSAVISIAMKADWMKDTWFFTIDGWHRCSALCRLLATQEGQPRESKVTEVMEDDEIVPAAESLYDKYRSVMSCKPQSFTNHHSLVLVYSRFPVFIVDASKVSVVQLGVCLNIMSHAHVEQDLLSHVEFVKASVTEFQEKNPKKKVGQTNIAKHIFKVRGLDPESDAVKTKVVVVSVLSLSCLYVLPGSLADNANFQPNF